ncbi:hypothetical protein [Maridesulfovibrio ferrireducens]|uniref:phage head spike fiber domain-containing protein n=1 Tax=Maridesulfovibrio ferrireducens TaxID=246191 RepID=UPI001A263ED3|nr:hypothetical protein [Maridesulfovibrio ferrireducens]MBI9113140.1 hypothetical protein [Maridesulfovibrio ferrireducens]
MSVPTVNVTIQVNDSLGNPVEGARVSAKLTTADKYLGFVVPQLAETISDVDGASVLALFPNELGSEGSEYDFKILLPTGKSLKFPAVIPNMDCNLFEIANVPPYPRGYVGDVITVPVIAARDEVLASAAVVAQSETNALASENNASQFSADAQQSKSDALSSSVSASTSAGQSEVSKLAAESARDAAQAAKVGAESARDGAQAAKDSVDASVASIPGLIDVEKNEALSELEASKAQLQTDLDLNKSQQARAIGGTAYQSILGLPCPPSLEVKAYDSKDNTNGVPAGFTFARASTATQINAVGEVESVANDVLRHEYDAENGEYKGFLIEEPRTNLLPYSEELNQSPWFIQRASVAVNTTTAPNGLVTADKILEDSTSSNSHYARRTISVIEGEPYSYSVFLKAGERTRCAVFLGDSGFSGDFFATVDLSSGTAVGGKIESFPNGWFRVSVVGVATSTSAGRLAYTQLRNNDNMSIYDGDGTSGLYIWGAQLEQGAFPTSYIPTTTAAATRAADTLSIYTTNFPYNQMEGTLCAVADDEGSGPILVMCDAGNGYIRLGTRVGFLDFSLQNIDAVFQFSKSFPCNDPSRILAFAFKENDFAVSAQGDPVQTGGGFFADQIRLTLGSIWGNFLNGHISQISYFPRRLSNEQLQALTR